MRVRHPLTILPGEQSGKPFKATTSAEKVTQLSSSARADLALIERDYAAVVAAARQALGAAGRGKLDPRLMWLVGDQLQAFLSRIKELGFYLVRQNDTFARDLKVAEVSIRKILFFRRRYPSISSVNPAVPWARYRDNRA